MDGVLLVNKPSGMTSHDVVAFLRRNLNMKRIGHTGTLDPNATGLLICLLGNATKILPYLERHNKEYVASLSLGIKTETADIWGNIIEEKNVPSFTENEIINVLSTLIGQQMQMPPMVSALKHKGKALYQYARDGITIERKERVITIHALKMQSFTKDTITFIVNCSAGTYVRTLAEEIGSRLNTVATMSALKRTAIGTFQLKNSYTLQEIENKEFQLLSIEEALCHLEKVEYSDVQAIKDGKPISIAKTADLIIVMNNDKAIAIYEWVNDCYYCKRGLW